MAAESLFPIAYGNEEETGMLVTGDYSSDMVEPKYFCEHMEDFIPPDLQHIGSDRIFLSNGGLVYPGLAIVDRIDGDIAITNPERTTPECSDLNQVSDYIDAHEKLIVEMSKIYAEKGANNRGDTVEVRLQRRTVDSAGNRKASHDSYGYRFDEERPFPTNEPRVLQSLLGFLATQPHVTGAGHVTSSGLRLSQKIHGLKGEEGYGYFGTMYRIDKTEDYDNVHRLETRLNDINLSGWAKRVRFGGVALHLALGQTELAEQLPIFPGGTNHAEQAKRLNKIAFDRDGELVPQPHHFEALAYQRIVAELALDLLHLYTEVPDQYFKVALEIVKYCDDFEAVLRKEKPFCVLADRSDAMLKFHYIARRVQRDRDLGKIRQMTDMTARMHDMQYDYIDIHAKPFTPAEVSYGYGYRLRNKGHFVFGYDRAAVERAYYRPPKGMRAQVRATIMRQYDTTGATVTMDWHRIQVKRPDHPSPQSVTLGDVDSDTLLLSTKKFLDTTFPRRTKR